MSIRGSCSCRNLELVWHTVDYSVAPRACQCDYCRAKDAAYVSKSRTAVELRVHKEPLHRICEHGSKSAQFHECANCGDVVLVTANIDGEMYGALNARCLVNPQGFSGDIETHFDAQTAAQKRERWRRNWCSPVKLSVI